MWPQQKFAVFKSRPRLHKLKTSLLLELDGAQGRSPQNADNSPHQHNLFTKALWFIFLWRSIDFLLFSFALIPGSVSSAVLYRGAIIRSLITAPLAAYLFPGDSLFKPPPNDLGKLTCSTSQDCRAWLMSEGVAPARGVTGPVKARKIETHRPFTMYSAVFIFYRWPSQVCWTTASRSWLHSHKNELICSREVPEPIWTFVCHHLKQCF